MHVIYLRKSRSDTLNDQRLGDGATLANHENILLDLAKKLNLNIGAIYREVASGETIAQRPIMQQLLAEVEQGKWDSVLVAEIERLARGDTMDQGLVAQTFKYSNTQIITPMKTYDPSDEFDEEYFEFGLFMSRREFKTINRRQQRGRQSACTAGKYVANKPPYGYDRLKLNDQKGFTLDPNPDQAPIVKMIFDLYVNKRLGPTQIADELDRYNVPTPTNKPHWSQHTIRDILRNEVYIGKIRWKHRAQQKQMIDGLATKTRPVNRNCQLYDGLHPAIVNQEIFLKADQLMHSNTTSVKRNLEMKNPLSGLLVCGVCKRKMVRRPYTNGYPDAIMCNDKHCPTVSSDLNLVENRILAALAEWVENYKVEISNHDMSNKSDTFLAKTATANTIEKEISTLQKQLNAMYDLLEQGIYTIDTFTDRSAQVSERLQKSKGILQELRKALDAEQTNQSLRQSFIPKLERLLSIYENSDIKTKNTLLKEILKSIEYQKTERGKRNGAGTDSFKITLYPLLPKE